MRDEREALLDALQPWLSDDYCARCDSFGHTEKKDSARLWCNVCWDAAKPLPYSLRRWIETARNA